MLASMLSYIIFSIIIVLLFSSRLEVIIARVRFCQVALTKKYTWAWSKLCENLTKILTNSLTKIYEFTF